MEIAHLEEYRPGDDDFMFAIEECDEYGDYPEDYCGLCEDEEDEAVGEWV